MKGLLLLMAPAATIFITIIISVGLAPSCNAATYMVGDTSGWDISTDLNTWRQGKTFYAGDVLVFQYSSSDNVEELSKEYYDNCTTTRPLQTFSNGNTSVPLTRPGPWYFASGNRLYCLGGMKLQVNVENNQATSPAGSPAGAPAASIRPSTKSDNPTSTARPVTRNGLLLLASAFLWWICAFV